MSRKLACVTLDIEPDLRDPQRRVRLFDDARLRSRYESTIQANDLKVTGFLVTSLIEPYGQALRQLSQQIPMEYSLHSHSHNARDTSSREEITRAVDAYQAFFNVRPLGYRAPFGLVDRTGIRDLVDLQFEYDSSIVPSLRLDEYSYSHVHLPNGPFRFTLGEKSLVELPIACLQGIRLGFSLSYAKLLGPAWYRLLTTVFPLPDVVVVVSHPYDYYVPLIADHLQGWKKLAHLRNSHRTFNVFEDMVRLLRRKGHEFVYMSELNNYIRGLPGLPEVRVDEDW
jgi:peptidoglycan/xylan/chitin deacetylase (PgdA/CDA1 family)